MLDSWNGIAIDGCTYHVNHPGGRSYEAFPVNIFEAESRRVNRFWDYNHSPGSIKPQRSEENIKTQNAFNPQGEKLQKQANNETINAENYRVFFVHSHKARPMEPPKEEVSEDYPHTLDLRKGPEY